MNQNLKSISVPLLRWTLGIVVLFESIRFIFSSSAAHFIAKAGLPSWIRSALGGGEIIAAILFLVPYTSIAGSYALLVIFALAAIVHFLHGQFDVGGMIVYAVAVIVCTTHREDANAEAVYDGR